MTTIELLESMMVSDKIAFDPFQNKRMDEDRRGPDFRRQEIHLERRTSPERRLPDVLYAEIDEHVVIVPT